MMWCFFEIRAIRLATDPKFELEGAGLAFATSSPTSAPSYETLSPANLLFLAPAAVVDDGYVSALNYRVCLSIRLRISWCFEAREASSCDA